jgi:hypothetical protein
MIGFRMHDLIYGGNMAEEAKNGYVKAWEEFGMLDEAGNFKTLVLTNSRTPVTIPYAPMNLWLMTLLHSWYPEIVEAQYPILMERVLLGGPNGTRWINPSEGGEGGTPSSEEDEPLLPVLALGWGACAASELGDTETVEGILGYADLILNAAWQDGGYYYKRRDANFDENGYYIGMDAMGGNALLHYARLNVKDGLKKLFDGPLDDAHFEQPALIDLPDDLDIRRAIFDADRDALALTLGALPVGRKVRLDIRAPAGADLPIVLKDGVELEDAIERTAAGLSVELHHHDRSTLVLQW